MLNQDPGGYGYQPNARLHVGQTAQLFEFPRHVAALVPVPNAQAASTRTQIQMAAESLIRGTQQPWLEQQGSRARAPGSEEVSRGRVSAHGLRLAPCDPSDLQREQAKSTVRLGDLF